MSNVNSMPFRLALLRHADAEWPLPGERDFDRRLSLFGEKEAQASHLFLSNIGFSPDIIATSPARRCLETLHIISSQSRTSIPTHEHGNLYNSSVEEYLNTIGQYVEHANLLLVGHNPILEELVTQLIGVHLSDMTMPHGFQTGAIAVIDIDRIANTIAKTGKLISYFHPTDAR